MNGLFRPASGFSSAHRWALVAGVYAFTCATVTAVLLSDVLGLFAEVMGLPGVLSMPLLASPALVAGAGIWWLLVERSDAHTYPRGAAFGLFTALATGVTWTVPFAAVWGVEMLTAGPVPLLVGFTLGVTAVAGALVGLPITYARRRDETRSDAVATANSL